ncbi:MAG TPA: peptidase domain-containing ABC transporter [Xanthomonadaceae bacterium]|nr:peptidase domain-containing ABC transporter [Xanthomonadaceae bacterium]
MNLLSIDAWRRPGSAPLVLQSEKGECGLACIAMVAAAHGHHRSLRDLRRQFGSSSSGTSLKRLAEIATALGLTTRALRAEPEYLRIASAPCILHWDMDHFVVLLRIRGNTAHLHDPAVGRVRMALDELGRHFTGVLLEAEPGLQFQKRAPEQRVPLARIFGKTPGLKAALAQLAGLSLIVEMTTLLGATQFKVVVDDILPAEDLSLLALISGAYLLLAGLVATTDLVRGQISAWLGPRLGAQWSANLTKHLLNLPPEYFDKRHLGDILSRLASVRSIQNALSTGVVDSIVDILVIAVALPILATISREMLLPVILVSALHALMKRFQVETALDISRRTVELQAMHQSELIESVKGIHAIKLANQQFSRGAQISSRLHDLAALDFSLGALNSRVSAGSKALASLRRIALLGAGAFLAIKGVGSAGAVIAGVAVADQFGAKLFNVFDRYSELRLLKIHVERIADIALADPEPSSGGEPEQCTDIESIELQGVGFRYSPTSPWILRNFSETFLAGESVAITGASGCGKSTLARILVGLLEPEEGRVLVNGVELGAFGLARFRSALGAVMQGDLLYSGTIAENISFYSEEAGQDEIQNAALLADVHGDIARMPMGYRTRIGDSGIALSGGQVQRIILARALFRKPRILLLDEATSHLDVESERRVSAHIRMLSSIRILIAHRPETIRSCDREVRLANAHGATTSPKEEVQCQ